MPNQTLANIRTGRRTDSGLFLGVDPLDAPLWIDGENIIFRDGGPQKIKGWTTATSITDTGIIRGMNALIDNDGTRRLYFGTQDSLHVWNADTDTNYTLSTGFSGNVDQSGNTPATIWSIARAGDWAVLTNGIDTPQISKDGQTSSDLGGIGAVSVTKAEIAVIFKAHLHLFNTTTPNTWHWSAADQFETFDPASNNSAGVLFIRGMNGPIQAVIPFGDNLAVFSRNQLFSVRFLGAPLYFGYEHVLDGIGAVGKSAVVEANRRMYGLSNAGIWRTDGTSYEYVDALKVREWLRDNLNEDQQSKVVATYESINENVVFFVPTTTNEPDTALVYHEPSGAWSKWSFGRSSAVSSSLGVFTRPYYADGTTIYKHETGESADGGSLTAFVQTKPLTFGEDSKNKLVNHVYSQVRGLSGSLNLQVGSQQNQTDSIAYEATQSLSEGFAQTDHRVHGRFITLKYESSGTSDDWKLAGFDVEGRVLGHRP